MVKLVRHEKPKTCEMYVKDKSTGMLRRCNNKIEFINKYSGGFLCVSCANKLHKRFPNNIKLYNAKKYIKKWYK